MTKSKYTLIIVICLLLCLGTYLLLYKQRQIKDDYNELYIDFIEYEPIEIGTTIYPVELIRRTNATDIIYPEIDTNTIGTQTLIYSAFDANHQRKEFVYQIEIVDTILPALTLTHDKVTITEGDSFDPSAYIKESYDERDGPLEATYTLPDNYLNVGTHTIVYSVTDLSGNTVNQQLTLNVKEKEPIKQETAVSKHNTPSSGSGSGNKKPSKKKITKDFLFSDGYDMDTADQACLLEMDTYKNRQRRCEPIKKDGVYIGMRLIVK